MMDRLEDGEKSGHEQLPGPHKMKWLLTKTKHKYQYSVAYLINSFTKILCHTFR